MAHQKPLLANPIEHIDITQNQSWETWVNAMQHTAFQARNLANAAKIYSKMLADSQCSVILCLAGSLVSAGLKKVIVDLIENNLVDIIVSNGANIVDQDFFEALGFKHYQGSALLDDESLRSQAIDRIYDTLIDEDELRICDNTIYELANRLPAKSYSSREFIMEMGKYLESHYPQSCSIVRSAFRKQVPIFVPAFSDCSAGFGLVMHQVHSPEHYLSIDSVKDFREFTQIKISTHDTGLLMIGGGVPKNFAQDIVVAAEVLGHETPRHKYAVQVTVADERDGALSGSTLREACSWGKVAITDEQMVFCEATIAFPIIAGYGYQKSRHLQRQEKRYNAFLTNLAESSVNATTMAT